MGFLICVVSFLIGYLVSTWDSTDFNWFISSVNSFSNLLFVEEITQRYKSKNTGAKPSKNIHYHTSQIQFSTFIFTFVCHLICIWLVATLFPSRRSLNPPPPFFSFQTEASLNEECSRSLTRTVLQSYFSPNVNKPQRQMGFTCWFCFASDQLCAERNKSRWIDYPSAPLPPLSRKTTGSSARLQEG